MAGEVPSEEKSRRHGPQSNPQRDSTRSLSDREREVLALLALGYSRAEVAELLFVGLETVKAHLKHIYVKLDATSGASAIYRAIQGGWLSVHYLDESSVRSQPFQRRSGQRWNGQPEDLWRILIADSQNFSPVP